MVTSRPRWYLSPAFTLILIVIALLATIYGCDRKDGGAPKPDTPDSLKDTTGAVDSVPAAWPEDSPPVAPPDTAPIEVSQRVTAVRYSYAGTVPAASHDLTKLDEGDTLNYRVRWPKFPGATRYIYGLRSTPTGTKYKWTLSVNGKLTPTAVEIADTFTSFALIDTLPWDTTTFRLVVWGKNAAGTSRDSIQTTWKVGRIPTRPGGEPVVEPIVNRVILKPGSAAVVSASQECKLATRKVDSAGNVLNVCRDGGKATGAPMIVQWCAYVQVKRNGAVDPWYYFTPGQEKLPKCREYYREFPAANRPPDTYPTPYPVASGEAAASLNRLTIAIEREGEQRHVPLVFLETGAVAGLVSFTH